MVISTKQFIFVSISLICILTTTFFYCTIENDLSISLTLFTIQLILFFALSWNTQEGLFKNLLNPSYIALIGLLIVNFQNVINVYFGFGTPSSYSVRPVSENIFLQSSYLSIIGTSFFLLTIFSFNPRIKKKRGLHRKYNTKIWLFLIILTFCGFIVTADIGRILSGEAYADDVATSTDMYFEGLLKSCIVIYITLTVINNKNSDVEKTSLFNYLKKFPIVFWVIVMMYLMMRFVSGDRGPVLYTSLLILYSYLFLTGRKLKNTTILLGGIVVAFIITLIGIARMEAMRASFGDRVTEAFEALNGDNKDQNTISPYTQELANSSKCIWLAMDAHNQNAIDFQCGRYTFFNLIQSVPFAGSVLKNLFGLNWNNVSSSSFITKWGLGPNPSYGLGTSAVADFYLELGFVGVILGFITAGLLFKYMDVILYFRTPVSATLLMFTFQVASLSIYFSRYSLSGCIYQGLICVILFLFVTSFSRILKK